MSMKGGRFGALERTRTSDPQLRKLMLYPLSYERARLSRTDRSTILPELAEIHGTAQRPRLRILNFGTGRSEPSVLTGALEFANLAIRSVSTCWI